MTHESAAARKQALRLTGAVIAMITIGISALLCTPGCDAWQPPTPSPEEWADGLVALYPGSTNSYGEMAGIYRGLRDAGVGQAIEILPWGWPLERFLNPVDLLARLRPRARAEAARIAEYRAGYPGRPVTLLGVSGGAMFAILVAEELPEPVTVDCVVLLSPGVSRFYDLSRMLGHVSQRTTVYFSPRDFFEAVLSETLGTADGVRDEPAAVGGFDTLDPRLVQIMWTSELERGGDHGGHFDYQRSGSWISREVAQWTCAGVEPSGLQNITSRMP